MRRREFLVLGSAAAIAPALPIVSAANEPSGLTAMQSILAAGERRRLGQLAAYQGMKLKDELAMLEHYQSILLQQLGTQGVYIDDVPWNPRLDLAPQDWNGKVFEVA